jgi:hypothetical protein
MLMEGEYIKQAYQDRSFPVAERLSEEPIKVVVNDIYIKAVKVAPFKKINQLFLVASSI